MSGWFVVTGSSKGVGLEICRIFIERGYRVVGLSRTPGPLNDCDKFEWVKCDLSSAEELYSAVKQIDSIADRQIDGLVFNAAAGYYGDALEMSRQDLNRLVEQNFTNQVVFLQLLAPWINKRTELFYVSTSASRIPAPMMAVYAATKAAFEFFIQSVSVERGFRIHIVRPAEIDTTFSKTVGVPAEAELSQHKLSPKAVAEEIISLLGSGRIFHNVGYRSKLIDMVVRMWPTLMFKRPSAHIKAR